MSDIKVGDRVRIVRPMQGHGLKRYVGQEGNVVELDENDRLPYAVEVVDADGEGYHVWCTEVELVEPEWKVGDACEVLLGGAWSRGVVHSVRADECCVTGVPGDGWSTWASLADMRRPQAPVGPDPVETLRREVEALRTRVADIEAAHGWPSEDAEPDVVHVWSDGTVGPTRPITEDDIGKPLPSVRTVSAEDLARELAAMTERAETAELERDALRKAADVVAYALGLVGYREGQGSVYGSLNECAERARRLVAIESRHAELRESIRAVLGEAE